MSGGHSSGQTNGGFAALVNNVIEGKKSNKSEDGESQQTNKAPSKGLPATGLKKNTLEWQESNGSGKQQNGDGGQQQRRLSQQSSRQSSSSSIPSNADGSLDKRTRSERQHDQEGPAGRGPGGHEPDLRLNDEPMQESPQSSTHELASIPAPRGSAGDGAATPVPPEYFRDNAKEDIPNRGTAEDKAGNGMDTKGKGKGKQIETEDGDKGDGFDPEEHVEDRQSGNIRKLTDEAGRFPEGMSGVKPEAPPGSQNQIVMDPRLPQIHVSRHFTVPELISFG